MHRIYKFLTLSLILTLFAVAASAQAPVIKPSYIPGEVVSTSAEMIVIKAADGEIKISLTDKTQYFRVPPDNPTLKAAVPAVLSDIGAGDKVVVSGVLSEDKKSIPARGVYLTSKSDYAQAQQKEREDWRVRGTVGRVDNFNPQTSVITITTRGMMGERKIAVKPKRDAEFYRYAPDSIEFSKALKSKIADIEPMDEIRVLGNRNADGSEIEAERIVTGAFRTNSGVVKSINAEKNEVVITDSTNKKDITIAIGENSILKQFPTEIATRMAQMQAMQAMGGGGMRPPNAGGQTPPQPNPQTPGQTPGGMGGGPRPGGGIDDSRFPSIKLADLKVGETIGVLSSKSQDQSRVRAIKLFSGVEPFVKVAQQMAAANPNRQGGGASMNIPGLDGFGGN